MDNQLQTTDATNNNTITSSSLIQSIKSGLTGILVSRKYLFAIFTVCVASLIHLKTGGLSPAFAGTISAITGFLFTAHAISDVANRNNPTDNKP